MIKGFLIPIFLLLLSCETKQYASPASNPQVTNDATSLFGSQLSFNGISSITSVTDTSAIINWTEVDGATEYYIYDVTNGLITYYDKIKAPASSYAATKLLSGTTYTFAVRVKDEDAQLDNNFESITITTEAQPDAPTISLKSSGDGLTYDNDVKPSPWVTVSGIRPGDSVSVYTDSTCDTLIETYDLEIEGAGISFPVGPLDSTGTYEFYAKITNINGIDSDCSTSKADYEYLACPGGYIPVDLSAGNPYGLNDFCVMQFEARAWVDGNFLPADGLPDIFDSWSSTGCDPNDSSCSIGPWGTDSYKPGSFTYYNPWRKLDLQSAKDECRSLGDGYDLINIREWMAIASDVEGVDANWSNGTAGEAGECLFRGNVGIDDDCGYAATTSSGIDWGLTTGRDQKAGLELSNGEKIWDFSGNVAEWVDFGIVDSTISDVELGPDYCEESWTEYGISYICDYDNDLTLDLDEYFYVPGNPGNITVSDYNSDYGLGQFEGGLGGATVRGGSYRNGKYAGVFSISFSANLNTTSEEIGFRCVFRP